MHAGMQSDKQKHSSEKSQAARATVSAGQDSSTSTTPHLSLQWSHLDPLLMRDVAFWNLKPLVNHAVALARGGRWTHFVVGPSVVRHLCVTSCYDVASGLVLRAFVRVFLASVPERPPFFCWLRDLKTKKSNNDCQFKPIRLFPL